MLLNTQLCDNSNAINPPKYLKSFDAVVTGKVCSYAHVLNFFSVLLYEAITECLITFRVRHSRGEMYSDHGRLCVCLCVWHQPFKCNF